MLFIETPNNVRAWTMNRPDALNAFNSDMWNAFIDALTEAREDNTAG